MTTVAGLRECYETFVREFIVNIPRERDNISNKEYIKVFVRGNCIEFSPQIINRYVERNVSKQVEMEVIDNTICIKISAERVTYWPRKKKLSVSDLTIKYVVLNRIGVVNWVPKNDTSLITIRLGKFIYIVGTKTKVDFGNYVFEQIVKHTRSYGVKMPIAFPTIICGIIMNQHPGILNILDE
ncbi:unnamed protein product [Vicia faba]|uniref:Putative plant transposon protein domain-containing protein n=1 Tax=Vicia faba TaxID=3906 RepID=A0AAV0ZNG0_VICFA|nr:unnamed protein product [Vicia faba]